MTHDGALFIEWIQSPQQGRADVYRITFAKYQSPEHMLFAQEVGTEGDIRQFLGEEIECTEDAMKEFGWRSRTKIDHIQLSDEVLKKLRSGEN